MEKNGITFVIIHVSFSYRRRTLFEGDLLQSRICHREFSTEKIIGNHDLMSVECTGI